MTVPASSLPQVTIMPDGSASPSTFDVQGQSSASMDIHKDEDKDGKWVFFISHNRS